MKFDFASIVDKEFSNLVWTRSGLVDQIIDKYERRKLLWKRNRRYLLILLLTALFCLSIYISWTMLQ